MPMPRRSGDVKRSSVSEWDRRVPEATFSPTPLRSRSPILPRSSEISGVMCSALVALDGERGVVATEAEAVAENSADVAFDRGIGGVVEVELGVGMMVVDGRRDDAAADNAGADDRLDRACGPQHVASRRLGRADIHFLRLVAEDSLYGARLV